MTRPTKRGSTHLRAWMAVVCAVVIHVVLLLWIGHEMAERQRSDRARASAQRAEEEARASAEGAPLEIETLIDDLQRPVRRTPAELREEAKRKEEEESRQPRGQVVDIARPIIEERPDKAEYAAEYDSRVERETKARPGRDHAGAREAQPAPERRPPAPSLSGNPLARPGAPGPLAMRAPERPHGARGEEGERETESESARRDGREPKSGAAGELESPRPAVGQGGIPGRPGAPNLQPTEEMLMRAVGQGAGSPDYLKDVDDGDATALNAKKWKFASFFNRVKRAVADEWHPDVVYLRHDPSGNVYGLRDRVTVLRVHLKPDGGLDSLTMLQSSGVEFLDEEAMDAFRRAQPFPHPPAQLLEEDGKIHFNFGFIFELSGHTSFRYYRYQ